MVDIPDMAIPQLKLSDIARAHPKQRLSCQKLKERPNSLLNSMWLALANDIHAEKRHVIWKVTVGFSLSFFSLLNVTDPWRRAWQPPLVFLFGESPWTEESGRLQSTGLQRVDMTERLKTAQCFRQGLCIGFSPHDKQSLLIHLLWT